MKREFSPYAVTQLRAILLACMKIDRERAQLKGDFSQFGLPMAKLDARKSELIQEAKLVGFPRTAVKAVLRHLRARGLADPPSSDAALVDLYQRVVGAIEGPRQREIVARFRSPLNPRQ